MFSVLLLLTLLPCSLEGIGDKKINDCNRFGLTDIRCLQQRDNYTDLSIEPSREEEDRALRTHNRLLNLTREEENARTTAIREHLTTQGMKSTTAKALNNSCKYVDFEDLIVSNTEESFTLKAGLNYRIRFDNANYEDIKTVEWTMGRHRISEYDWSKACFEQRVAVDTDEKSLLLLGVSTQYEQFPYFATATLKNSSSVLQFEIKLAIEKEHQPSVYTSDIIRWGCFAGAALLMVIFLIVAHLIHQRYMRRQIREMERQRGEQRPNQQIVQERTDETMERAPQ